MENTGIEELRAQYEERRREFYALDEKLKSQRRYADWLERAARHAATEAEFWQYNEKTAAARRELDGLGAELTKARWRMSTADIALRQQGQ